jgi:filamentous hemagglutinin family protein
VVLTTAGASLTLQGAVIQFASASQIQATVNVGGTARTWMVQVVNPNGIASSAATLTVK